MLRKPIHISAGEPSFFYLMMAESCFRRAGSTRHPNAGGALRDIGRNYLAKANGVASTLESQPLPIDHNNLSFRSRMPLNA
jgi:hypothetical protein